MAWINFGSKPKIFVSLVLLVASNLVCAQGTETAIKSDFWRRVQFGGGLGLNFGSGYTDATVAPGAIYNFNDYVALGVGLQGSYISSKDYYSSMLYGGSIIGLFNPFDQIQLSLELEEVRVNNKFELPEGGNYKDNFWNTGLFIGAGYRVENVTLGVRYNVLFDKDKSVYNEAFMPFVRVYF